MSFLSETIGKGTGAAPASSSSAFPKAKGSFLRGIETEASSGPTPIRVSAPGLDLASRAAVDAKNAEYANSFTGLAKETAKGVVAPLVAGYEAAAAQVKPKSLNPLTAAQDAAQAVKDSFSTAVDDAGKKVSDAVSTLGDAHATLLSKGVGVGEAALGTLSPIFAALTAPLTYASRLPGIGQVADKVNELFSAIGSGASAYASTGLVDALPISPQTKDTIRPLVGDVAALAAQLYAGKVGGEAIGTIADKSKAILGAVKDDPHVQAAPSVAIRSPEQTKVVSDVIDEHVRTAQELLDPKEGLSPEKLAEDGGIPGVITRVQTNVADALDAYKLPDEAKLVRAIDPKAYTTVDDYARAIRDATGSNPAVKLPVQGLSEARQVPFDNQYTPEGQLPVIDAGPKPRETLPTIEAGAPGIKAPPGLTYEPVGSFLKGTIGSTETARTPVSRETGGPALPPVAAAERGALRPIGEGQVRTPRLAANIEANAIEKGLVNKFGDLPEYKQVNMKEQADLATNLLQNDPARALRVALGQELPPEGILPEVVLNAVEDRAVRAGDILTLRRLATESTLTSEATAMGQRIRALAERDQDSPVKLIQDVQKAREATALKRAGTKTTYTAKQAAIREVKTDIGEAAKASRPTWESFMQELTCNI